jgi:hypothetical protein
VRSRFQALLDDIRTFVAEAERMETDLVIERKGPAIDWWR